MECCHSSARRDDELDCHIHTVTETWAHVIGERISGARRGREMPHFHNFLKTSKDIAGFSHKNCCFVNLGNWFFQEKEPWVEKGALNLLLAQVKAASGCTHLIKFRCGHWAGYWRNEGQHLALESCIMCLDPGWKHLEAELLSFSFTTIFITFRKVPAILQAIKMYVQIDHCKQ